MYYVEQWLITDKKRSYGMITAGLARALTWEHVLGLVQINNDKILVVLSGSPGCDFTLICVPGTISLSLIFHGYQKITLIIYTQIHVFLTLN